MFDGDDWDDPEVGAADARKYRARYDVGNESPSLALVEAIAAAKGVDPFALDPLGNAVDMDALDAVVEPTGRDNAVQVTVVSQGVRATIDNEGAVVVQLTG